MLLEFSVKNYKVFKERATMSFIASNYDKSTLETSNVVSVDTHDLRVLRSAVLYGANASGKTKFFEALEFFRRFVRKSSKEGQKGEMIDTQPFLLSETTEHGPSEFEIVFLHDSVIYRYGFEANSKAVLAEWLFYRPQSKEYQVFYRDTLEPSIKVDKTLFKKGNLLIQENLVRDNALMLSVAAQFNDEICSQVINWFNHDLTIVLGSNDQLLKAPARRGDSSMAKVLQLLRQTDISIQDLQLITQNLDISLGTVHHRYDKDNRIIGQTIIQFDEESEGTHRLVYLFERILSSWDSGKTLVVDDFDSHLHPKVIQFLLSLFNNPNLNPHGSQLIVSCHNTALLQTNQLRKDQIWLIEKDRFEASHIYSLTDFKSILVRSGENFETNYLKGKYGAIPYV